MTRRKSTALIASAAAVTALTAVGTAALTDQPATGAERVPGSAALQASRACPPSAKALGFTDALDKRHAYGAEIGGLSSLAYDSYAHAYVSSVDNDGTEPSRVWFFRDLAHPTLTRAPLVLKRPSGRPYTGETADNEGLGVLPDGDFVVSSETEPSIRIYRHDGVQRASLPVPSRFQVMPEGQATANSTLEGLAVSPSGRRIVASMEGTLSGDVPTDHTPHAFRRFLVYDRTPGHRFRLTKQIGYRVTGSNRIPDVQVYGTNHLLVEEAYFDAAKGNTVSLYSVRGLQNAPDVSSVQNLSKHPGLTVSKHLVANVTQCPTLGAPHREKQTNPLMDNYEGVTIGAWHPLHGAYTRVSLISDDNFGDNQYTRILRLEARLRP